MCSFPNVYSKICIFLCLALLRPYLCLSYAAAIERRSNSRRFNGKASSTMSPRCSSRNDDDSFQPTLLLGRNPPYLAIITEPDACDSDEKVDRTFEAICQAVSNNQVDLISIRQAVPANIQEQSNVSKRLISLSDQLFELSLRYQFRLVISSDWMSLHNQVRVHGIHVKESHRERIPEIRKMLRKNDDDDDDDDASIIIGTSAHSVPTAVNAWQKYRPDYMFVGTCYVTQTHPEKSLDDLEGPALPGQVVQTLRQEIDSSSFSSSSSLRPIIFAIGGINVENCHEPVQIHGADGVAAIRAVLQSSDPGQTVLEIKQNMQAKKQ